ncbi:MAG: glycosyltransferase N-terminal domain-containing protein [Endomicrobiaceae bacterium]|nr:glycosyltransferase N-terminal domain-containing protein [Endomicrobiaceae bacterium]
MAKLLLALYNCLLVAFLIPILLAIVLSGKKNRQDFFYCIKERVSLGNIPKFDTNKKNVWIHCSSLGEAKAVEPMIPYLQDYNVIVTTITKSAREYVSNIKGITYFSLMPVDVYPFISKMIKQIRPDILILIETEFWPSMIYCANSIGTKIVTINGRISKGAFVYYKITSLFWKTFLSLIDYVSVRNQQDYDRFVKILNNESKVGVTGNIKYDRDFTKEQIVREDLFYNKSDLILTAGSTRENEEIILIDIFKELKNELKNLKLILAPRHISRVKEINNILKQKQLKTKLLTELNTENQEDVLIIDTFGKLQSIYSISDIVFIGGSIVKSGGQNPIEPSAYSKPVVFGKYMFNFENEAKLLKDNGGAFEVSSKQELKEIISKLLKSEALRIEVGTKALEIVKMQKGAIETNINIIRKYLLYK